MGEHLNQRKPAKIDSPATDGFNAMGKPIPIRRKLVADQHLKEMGLHDGEDRFHCIGMVSERLERDDPYGAINEAMKYIDLTGSYRLMAALLTGETGETTESTP